MAVPKHKTSNMRARKRVANNSKITAPNLVSCPQCHELKVSHKVCPKCGYYDGKPVVATENAD